MRTLFITAMFCASPAFAGEVSEFEASDFDGARIVIVGEVHDDPGHHLAQAEIIKLIEPAAVVFEMLTPAQAERVMPNTLSDPDLGAVLGWEEAGWPDFGMYTPIFTALADASVFGAAPAEVVAQQARDDSLSAFGDDAEDYGLTNALPADESAQREQEMQDSHCGKLPPDILPWFVEQQRFRDAHFARATLQALEQTGGPVVVITGNGHARKDWGMPVYLAAAAPDVTVITVGQITNADGTPPFDLWRLTDPIDRPDPCAAFN